MRSQDPPLRSTSSARPDRIRRFLSGDRVSYVVGSVIFVFVAFSLVVIAVANRPMSVVDEHVHYDYALRVSDGQIPHRGSVYTRQLVDEWACGVSSEGGDLPFPCGDERNTADVLPSGQYTSGYIHYPTYFAGAAATRAIVDAISGGGIPPLTGYRLFSVVLQLAGIVVCFLIARVVGLRGSAQIAVAFIPVATSLILSSAPIVNPGSSAILAGALIGGTGLKWIMSGRGFGWLLAASLVGSLTAVTNSLPVGAFIISAMAAWISRRFGRDFIAFRPRLLHIALLSASVLIPVVVWGLYISSTATVANSTLYGFAPAATRRSIVVGFLTELTSLHTPWIDTSQLLPAVDSSAAAFALRGLVVGLPLWINVLVFGAIAIMLVRQFASTRAKAESPRDGTALSAYAVQKRSTATTLVALSSLTTLILYPAALRVSNSITFGFDFGITSRYSASFAPLLVMLALLLVRSRRFSGLLAVVGVVSAIGLCATWI